MRNVQALAKKTGCTTANHIPAPRVARTVQARAVVRPTTPALVTANALLAEIAFMARWDRCPASSQDLFDLFRQRR